MKIGEKLKNTYRSIRKEDESIILLYEQLIRNISDLSKINALRRRLP